MKKIEIYKKSETKNHIWVKNIEELKREHQYFIQQKYKEKESVKDDDFNFEYKDLGELIEFINLIKAFAQRVKLNFVFDQNIEKNIKEFEALKEQRKLFKEKCLQLKKGITIDENHCLDLIKKISKKQLNLVPHEMQYSAVYHNVLLGSSLNFSVPGTGKTLIAFLTFFYLNQEKEVNNMLVISPLSSFYAWKTEYKKTVKNINNWKLNSLEFIDLRTTKDDSSIRLSAKSSSPTIFIINFENLRSKEKILNEMVMKTKVFVVVDEAHKAKNEDTQRSKFSQVILDKCEQKLMMSGTPIPNGLGDLNYYTKNVFGKYDEDEKEAKKMYLNDCEMKQKKEKYLEMVAPFFWRIRKKDFGMVEGKIIYWKKFEMYKEQENLYKGLHYKLLKDLSEKMGMTNAQQMLKAQLIRLMQAAVDPRMIELSKKSFKEKEMNYPEDDDEFSETTKNETQDKNSILYAGIEEKENKEMLKKYKIEKLQIPDRYMYCVEQVKLLFEKEKIKKIVIWSSWVFVIQELERIFKENGFSTKSIYGATKSSDKGEYIDDFQKENGKIEILICNPMSVAESISLHNYCQNAIYFDCTWNATNFLQSKERIHRYKPGHENRDVTYYVILCPKTIDEKIIKTILKKEKEMIQVLESPDLLVNKKDNDGELIEEVLNQIEKENKHIS